MLTANILDIIRGTTVDGPGFRTSVYFAGCRHQCKGCHNPDSWRFDAGIPMTVNQIMDIICEEDFDVTLSGGDPLYHCDFVKQLIREVKKIGHTVWIYSGFTWEEISNNQDLIDTIREADVIVDSPFVQSLKDPDLLFRGSSNQRIIDIKKSLENINSDSYIIWERK